MAESSLLGLLDRYDLRARLVPALIVCLPLGLAVAAWFPGNEQIKGLPIGAAITLALGILLTQLGRGPGRKAQKELFHKWGGAPTERMLSHTHSSLNPLTVKAVHARLREMRPDLAIPSSAEEEALDPKGAGVVYEACTAHLRERTRDAAAYPLVLEENINFGFRRNLWAMRAAGIFSSAIGLLACTAAVAQTLLDRHPALSYGIPYGAVSVLLLVWWLLRITVEWVHEQAETYAKTLIESTLKVERS